MLKAEIESVLKTIIEENSKREKMLLDKINELETQLNEKVKTVEDKVSNPAQTSELTNPSSFASMLKIKENIESKNTLVNMAAKNSRKEKRRENNDLIILFNQTKGEEEIQVKEYFKAVCLEESTIRHVKKLTTNNKTRPSYMIQVILETNENKMDLMKRIKHKQIENFESVIVR